MRIKTTLTDRADFEQLVGVSDGRRHLAIGRRRRIDRVLQGARAQGEIFLLCRRR